MSTIHKVEINSVHVTGPFLQLLKTLGNHWLPEVFKAVKKETRGMIFVKTKVKIVPTL